MLVAPPGRRLGRVGTAPRVPVQWLASHGATASGWATGLLGYATLATAVTILACSAAPLLRR